MKQVVTVLGLMLAACGVSLGASCGTLLSPTPCSITVGGQVTYTVGNFNWGASNATGGGNTYQPGDVDIDIATGGGLTLSLTFSKLSGGPTPGIVFLANAGQTSAFSFTYDVTLSAAIPGTAAFTTPNIVNFTQSSATNSGFTSVQMILSGAPTSCSAVRNSSGPTQGNCTSLPPGLGATLSMGSIASLTGGPTGSNTSMNGFTNLLDATFTPSAGVPEPGTWLTMGLGLAALPLLRRLRRQ